MEEIFMDEFKKTATTYQNIVLENRERLNITGIVDVFSFDDQVIIVETELGLLTIKGENLKINKLSIDTSDFIVDGYISSLSYTNSDGMKKNQNFLSKIFK
jgi:sporulation protein YabP